MKFIGSLVVLAAERIHGLIDGIASYHQVCDENAKLRAEIYQYDISAKNASDHLWKVSEDNKQLREIQHEQINIGLGLSRKVDNLTRENTELKELVERITQGSRDLEAKNIVLQSKVDELTHRSCDLAARNIDLAQQRDAANEGLKSLRQASFTQNTDHEYQSLRQNVARLSEELKTTNDAYESEKASHAKTYQNFVDVTNQLKAKCAELDARNGIIDNLRKSLMGTL